MHDTNSDDTNDDNDRESMDYRALKYKMEYEDKLKDRGKPNNHKSALRWLILIIENPNRVLSFTIGHKSLPLLFRLIKCFKRQHIFDNRDTQHTVLCHNNKTYYGLK